MEIERIAIFSRVHKSIEKPQELLCVHLLAVLSLLIGIGGSLRAVSRNTLGMHPRESSSQLAPESIPNLGKLV